MLCVPRSLWLGARFDGVLARGLSALASRSPLTVLSERIERGELSADDHQKLVTEALENIYNAVQVYKPSLNSGGGFFGMFSSRKGLKSLAPKGLYVHGSVGGGKTTLMDLFYDCCTNVR